MNFNDIPIRKNTQYIDESWFNSLRQAGIDTSNPNNLTQYVSDSAFATSNVVSNGSIYYNTTFHKARLYQNGSWNNLGGDVALVSETPVGNVNNINVTFTLQNTPISNLVLVYVDGLLLKISEYTYTAPNVILNVAPKYGQEVTVTYITGGGIPATVITEGASVLEYHTIAGSEITNKSFNLSQTPAVNSKVLVDLIGACSQEFSVDFDIVGNVFSWNGLGLDGILQLNDVIRLKYLT